MALSTLTVPTATPQVAQPDASSSPNVPADAFGATQAKGLEQLGGSLSRAGAEWGKIQADDVANQFVDNANKILYGDPGVMVTKADGTQGPDEGYLGLRGRNALDQHKSYNDKMDALFKQAQSKVLTPRDQAQFDQLTRRQRSIYMGQMGAHAEREGKVYGTHVNTASARLAIEGIASDPENADAVAHGAADLTRAYMAEVNLQGGDENMAKEAVVRAKRDALVAQLNSIGVKNPSRAMAILEQNKNIAGTQYDNLFTRFRARADVQDGTQYADQKLGVGQVPPVGNDTLAVIKHFEGFISKAKRDNGGEFRVGYGSDTVTRADGRIEKVTPDTEITQADAERDLQRRAGLSARDVQDKIGAAAFDKLDDRTKASLTSISYNYGTLGKPELKEVVEAAKSGDADNIANAIRKLSPHDNGINATRRASEANNVSMQKDANGRPSIRDQADMIGEVLNDPQFADRPQAQSAAIHRINQVYGLHHNQQVASKAAFQSRIDDSATEALKTGATSNPIGKEEFLKQYGDIEGPVKYQTYIDDVQFGADYKAMQTMSDAQQQQLLSLRAPKAGDPGFAHAAKNQDRLQKAFEHVQKQRTEDPAGSVDQMPAIRDAFAKIDRNDPSTFQAVVSARMIAQEQLGIAPEDRSPISKPEALRLTAPLSRMLPGQEQDILEKVGAQFRDLLGPHAAQGFAYAIGLRHQRGQAGVAAASVLSNIAAGNPVTRQEQEAYDQQQQEESARKAITAPKPPAWSPFAGMDAMGAFGMGNGVLPAPSVGAPKPPPPSPKAITDLYRGTINTAQFDMTYGPGAAKRLFDKAPGLKKPEELQ